MALPDPSPESFAPLHEVLRGRRTAALIADAELIRDAQPGGDRDEEARRAIREAMLLFTLRRITRAERDRLLAILSFATVRETLSDTDQPRPRDCDHAEPHGPLT